MLFSDLGLSPEVLKAVEDAGYTQPTPIQEQAIPHVLMGRDVLGLAQTGTGKTASFTLPMIDVLASGKAKARMPRSLILEPTRELADQVAKNFETYGKYLKLNMALLIGGMSFADQEKKLDRGVDVLIATPGRLLDHFERGKVMLSGVKILVIDEADRMMDMGFIPDIERIVSLLPPLRQTLFFSATMSPEMRRLANAFLSNPKEVKVAPPASPAANVVQGLLRVHKADKRDALRKLIAREQVKNALIFCNRKRDVDILAKSLQKYGLDAAPLHGDMAQSARMEVLAKFKANELTFLVASDVAARGLDVQGLSHVFNFDVPMHAEDYIHRIGRTGRAGMAGRALTLASPEDGKYLAAITKLVGREIPALEVEGVEAADMAEAEAEKPKRRSRTAGKAKEKAEATETTEAPAERKPRTRRRRSAEATTAAATEAMETKTAQTETAESEAAVTEPVVTEAPARQQASVEAESPREAASYADEAEETGMAVSPIMATPDRKPTRQTPEPKPERRRGRRDDHDMGPAVIGFGDHVPAFILQPARQHQH